MLITQIKIVLVKKNMVDYKHHGKELVIMKIMHLVTIGTGEAGGKETFLIDLLNAIFDMNLARIKLVSFEENITTREIKRFPVEIVKIGKKFDKKGIELLRKAIESFNPDILHTHSYRDNFYGRVASKHLEKLKRFTTLHLPLSSNFIMPFYKRSFYQLVDNMTNYLVDGFIAVSHDMKKALLRQHIDDRKIRVIQNGLDYKSFEKQDDHSLLLREEWRLKPNQKVIGCIGRLTVQKGQEYLIKACSILKSKHPQIKLILIGNGILKKLYKKLALEQGVDLLLLEFRRDIRSCLKTMDVFVLPSIDEGLPITLLEAAEAEIPVVATRVGGVPEFLRDDTDALLIESGNPVRIAEAIDFILTHKNQANSMVKSARKRLVNDFSIEKTATKYVDFYKEVIER